MADHRRRVRTLQALVAGEPAMNGVAIHADIQREFDEIYACRRLRQEDRKRLLQLVHGCRAIDSTLKTVLIARDPTTHGLNSLGAYLIGFEKLGALTRQEQDHYQARVVDPRNKLMHNAGYYPSGDASVVAMLGEMETLLVRVL